MACAQGNLSLAMAPYARSVLAYDATAEYINLARESAEERGITNVKFLVYNARARFHAGQVRLPASGTGLYSGAVTSLFSAGAITVRNDSGGTDVGAFQASLAVPPPIVWKEADTIKDVVRARPLTLTWSGGDASREYVVVVGTALDTVTQARRKRPSADLYAEICKENGLSSEMVARYAPEVLEKIFPG